jgi:hypothetical protein
MEHHLRDALEPLCSPTLSESRRDDPIYPEAYLNLPWYSKIPESYTRLYS